MRRVLPVLAACSVLWGCPGPVPPPPADAGEVDAGVTLSPVELCDRLAKAKCELMKSCYPAFSRGFLADCQTAEQTGCLAQYDRYRLSFEEKKVEVNVAAVERCEARMASRTCPPTFPPGYSAAQSPFQECAVGPELMIGKVPSGEACRNEVECAPGVVCLKPNGVCNGTCSTLPVEGEPCAFGCGKNLYCDDRNTDQDTSDDRCAKLKDVDQSCVDSRQCATDLFCSNGACRARGKTGMPCVFDPNRTSTCEAGLACDVAPFVDGVTGTCVKPKGLLESCKFHWSCASGFVCGGIDWTLFPAEAPTTGACIPPQAAQSACNFTIYAQYVGDSCAAGTACSDQGVCRTLASRGEACTPSALSCSGVDVFCKPSSGGTSGICSGPAALNERCGIQIDNDRTVRIPCSAGYCEESTLTCRTGNKPIGDLCQSDAECSSNRCAVQQDRTQRCAAACN